MLEFISRTLSLEERFSLCNTGRVRGKTRLGNVFRGLFSPSFINFPVCSTPETVYATASEGSLSAT